MCVRFSPQISSFEIRFASSIVIVKTGRAGYGEVQTARTSVMIGLSSAGFFHTRLRHICIIEHERRDNEEGGQDCWLGSSVLLKSLTFISVSGDAEEEEGC